MVDELSGGSERPPRRRLAVSLGLVAVAAVIVVLAVSGDHDHHRAGPARTPATSARPTGTPTIPTTAPVVRSSSAGHPLLGATSGWDLLLWDYTAVTIIHPATGLVTTIPVPPIQSSDRVYFFATGNGIVVRPAGSVVGYVVTGAGPGAVQVDGLNHSPLALSGPRAGQMWVERADRIDGVLYDLVDLTGAPIATVSAPTAADRSPIGDGAGGLLIHTPGGWYDVIATGRSTSVTTGTLLAVGPAGYLVRECPAGRCGTYRLAHAGSRHRIRDVSQVAVRALPGAAPTSYDVGALSPHGRYAALLQLGTPAALVTVIDARTGAQVGAGVSFAGIPGDPSKLAFSPDDRWLFAVGSGARLIIFDTATGRTRPLGIPLPLVGQVAIRGR